MVELFYKNSPLYLMEAWGLGTFMISASLFTILLQYPSHWGLLSSIPSDFIRRLLIGLAMGSTAVAIIYSPWGRRSGAHMNPAITLTMCLLKKISVTNAFFYSCFQILGGTAGVYLIVWLFPQAMAHPAVDYVVTVPGKEGVLTAALGEGIISFLMMFTTLLTSNIPQTKKFTGLISGVLILSFVTFESPFSGFSMNPARTMASAIPSGNWTAWPLYIIVPILCMVLAAILYRLLFYKGRFHSLHYFFHPKQIR